MSADHQATCPVCNGSGIIAIPVGTRIGRLRKRLEMTQEEFARSVGMSRPSLANIEAGRQDVPLALEGGPVWTGKIGIASDQVLTAPLRWKRPRMIFVNSTSDLFHPGVPDSVIDRVFAVMAMCPQHTFQILTKRPERLRAYFRDRATGDPWAEAADYVADAIGLNDHPMVLEPRDIPLRNVWLGTSVEDQIRANERIPHLLDTPAAVRFLSVEPLLGPVDLRPFGLAVHHHPDNVDSPALQTIVRAARARFSAGKTIDWVIVGGESGNGARPMQPDWARSIRDQCTAAGVPFFFKQWGEYCPTSDANGPYMMQVGKKVAGRLLDGIEHDGMPVIAR